MSPQIKRPQETMSKLSLEARCQAAGMPKCTYLGHENIYDLFFKSDYDNADYKVIVDKGEKEDAAEADKELYTKLKEKIGKKAQDIRKKEMAEKNKWLDDHPDLKAEIKEKKDRKGSHKKMRMSVEELGEKLEECEEANQQKDATIELLTMDLEKIKKKYSDSIESSHENTNKFMALIAEAKAAIPHTGHSDEEMNKLESRCRKLEKQLEKAKAGSGDKASKKLEAMGHELDDAKAKNDAYGAKLKELGVDVDDL